MNFSEYQQASRATAVYPKYINAIFYCTLGLCGESGEVAEKIKKVLRDNGGVFTEQAKTAIKLELGDVLWYLSQLSTELGLDLKDIAAENLDKIRSRQTRQKLNGSGDDR
jgi:NTP pyrophosphatase (non-canonical NTP hydrolase)